MYYLNVRFSLNSDLQKKIDRNMQYISTPNRHTFSENREFLTSAQIIRCYYYAESALPRYV